MSAAGRHRLTPESTLSTMSLSRRDMFKLSSAVALTGSATASALVSGTPSASAAIAPRFPGHKPGRIYLGVAAGGNLETEMPGLTGVFSLKDVAMLVAYAVVMLGVCLLACVVPTRRALGVEPTTALRIE